MSAGFDGGRYTPLLNMTSINLVYEIFWQRSVQLLAQNDEKIEHQTSKHCLVEGAKRIRLGF